MKNRRAMYKTQKNAQEFLQDNSEYLNEITDNCYKTSNTIWTLEFLVYQLKYIRGFEFTKDKEEDLEYFLASIRKHNNQILNTAEVITAIIRDSVAEYLKKLDNKPKN